MSFRCVSFILAMAVHLESYTCTHIYKSIWALILLSTTFIVLKRFSFYKTNLNLQNKIIYDTELVLRTLWIKEKYRKSNIIAYKSSQKYTVRTDYTKSYRKNKPDLYLGKLLLVVYRLLFVTSFNLGIIIEY